MTIRSTRQTLLRSAVAAAALAAAGSAAAVQSRYNLAPPVTRIAEEIHGLHWMMMAICGVIFVAVFGVMFYSIYAHRRSKGAVPANFHESTKVEIIWSAIPLVVLIGLFFVGLAPYVNAKCPASIVKSTGRVR